MAGKRKIHERGKLQLSRYFQQMLLGESVAIKKNPSVPSSFPKRLQGKVGVIESKRGRSYIIKIKDVNKEKKFIIQPIHLKKIQN